MSNADLAAFTKRNPLGIACGIVALLSGIGIYLLNARIADSTLVLDQKTAEGGRLAANIRNAAQLPDQLEALTSAGNEIQSRLIRASQLAANLQYFYRLETESGVELIDLRQTTSSGQPAKGKAKTGVTGVGFAISVRGDYPTLLEGLRRLENGPHYSRVLLVSMSGSSADRTGPLTLSLSLELLGQP